MAILFSDGMDSYDNAATNVSKKWTVVSDTNVTTIQDGLTGGTCLKIFNSGGNIVGYQKNFAPQTQARFALWHKFGTDGTNTNNTRVCGISNSVTQADDIAFWGGSHIVIGMNSSLIPTIRINNVVVATGTTVLTANTWRHYEIYIDYKASGGTIEVRLNGDTEITYTGATYSGTGAAAMSWFNLSVTNGQSQQLYDDVLIYSTTGDAPNSWLGPTTITTLVPIIDAAPNQGTMTPVNDGLTPGAHAWWRFTLLASTGGGIGDIGELGWHTTFDGPSVAVGGTASASTGTAANAFDNNPNTYWRTFTFPSSLTYNFTAPISPVKVSLKASDESSSSLSYAPVSFRLEYSDNGSTWTTWRTIYAPQGVRNAFDYRQWIIGQDSKASRLSDGVMHTKSAQTSGTTGFTPEQTYVSLNTVNDTEMFEFNELTDPTLDIKVVVANSLVKSSGYSNRKVRHRIRSDYNVNESTNLNAAPGGTSTNVQSAHAVDPQTGSAWTLNALNAAEFGVRLAL